MDRPRGSKKTIVRRRNGSGSDSIGIHSLPTSEEEEEDVGGGKRPKPPPHPTIGQFVGVVDGFQATNEEVLSKVNSHPILSL